MKKRKVALVVAGLAAVGVIAFLLLSNREPRYGGHSLGYWLLRTRESRTETEASAAIRAIGTNAYPHLMKRLQTRDRFGDRFFLRYGGEKGFRYTSIRTRSDALTGLRLIGPQLGPWVPEIVGQFGNQNAAPYIAAGIGQPAVAAVTAALTNADPTVRMAAITSLEMFKCDVQEAKAAVLARLLDAHEEIAFAAATVLSKKIRPDAEVIAALGTNIQSGDIRVADSSFRALNLMRTNAVDALPAVLKAMESTNLEMRTRAEVVARAIQGNR